MSFGLINFITSTLPVRRRLPVQNYRWTTIGNERSVKNYVIAFITEKDLACCKQNSKSMDLFNMHVSLHVSTFEIILFCQNKYIERERIFWLWLLWGWSFFELIFWGHPNINMVFSICFMCEFLHADSLFSFMVDI